MWLKEETIMDKDNFRKLVSFLGDRGRTGEEESTYMNRSQWMNEKILVVIENKRCKT